VVLLSTTHILTSQSQVLIKTKILIEKIKIIKFLFILKKVI